MRLFEGSAIVPVELTIMEEFQDICTQIVTENKSEQEWSEIESTDMFQTRSFLGGFDATDQVFSFSYFDEQKKEFWFYLTLEEVEEVAKGLKHSIQLHTAD